MKKIKKIVCPSTRGNTKRLVEFQIEFYHLVSEGVPAEQIIKEWNDSQDDFFNRVYLVEEYSKADMEHMKDEFLNRVDK